MLSGTRPDVTPAQLVAAIGWVVAQAVAFGWLSSASSQLILSLSATVVAAAWKIADAVIRNGRSRPPIPPAPAAVYHTAPAAPVTPPPTS